jgi:hypothetical protein
MHPGKDPIYVVDPAGKKTTQVLPTTFFELKMKERQDLQEWLMDRPSVLGEELLLITAEFDKFDKSDKRIDLMLLDKEATLVVAELKLDASGSLAELQAIRYAAFLSTMTMAEVVEQLAHSVGVSEDEAAERIQSFLSTNELPELNGEPRVILAAGGFNDQELTSTVMWLRKFGVDVSCVELTPYRYPGDETNILLIPKVLIPLPEAKEYQISVERKERSELEKKKRSAFWEFFNAVLDHYGRTGSPLQGSAIQSVHSWMYLPTGHNQIHYEWLVHRRAKLVDVALHFEAKDLGLNLRRLQEVVAASPSVSDLLPYEMVQGTWHKGAWTQLAFRIPFTGRVPDKAVAAEAAEAMTKLIQATYPAVRALIAASP